MTNTKKARGAKIPMAKSRTNGYFVPKDGIDREVLTSDICRYLENDALIRPGCYEVISNLRTIE
jgi:hypothetical protein